MWAPIWMKTTSSNPTSLAQNFPLGRGIRSSQLSRKRNCNSLWTSGSAGESRGLRAATEGAAMDQVLSSSAKDVPDQLPHPTGEYCARAARANARGWGWQEFRVPQSQGGAQGLLAAAWGPRIHIPAPQAGLAILSNLSAFTSSSPGGSSAGPRRPLPRSFTCESCVFCFLLALVMDSPLLLSYSTGNGGIRRLT